MGRATDISLIFISELLLHPEENISSQVTAHLSLEMFAEEGKRWQQKLLPGIRFISPKFTQPESWMSSATPQTLETNQCYWELSHRACQLCHESPVSSALVLYWQYKAPRRAQTISWDFMLECHCSKGKYPFCCPSAGYRRQHLQYAAVKLLAEDSVG